MGFYCEPGFVEKNIGTRIDVIDEASPGLRRIKNPPRTRQRTLILAAFRPWGGSDDTVTRRIHNQCTRWNAKRRNLSKNPEFPVEIRGETRRMGDSNPRGLAPNTLSKRAP